MSRRKLNYQTDKENLGWTDSEDKAIVEFIMLSSDGSKWMWTKRLSFWESASQFVLKRCGAKRTSESSTKG